jgi:hypothetical protein
VASQLAKLHPVSPFQVDSTYTGPSAAMSEEDRDGRVHTFPARSLSAHWLLCMD